MKFATELKKPLIDEENKVQCEGGDDAKAADGENDGKLTCKDICSKQNVGILVCCVVMIIVYVIFSHQLGQRKSRNQEAVAPSGGVTEDGATPI